MPPAPSAGADRPAPPTARDLLTNRTFIRFWCARVLSVFAFQVIGVAVGWRVYDVTGSAYALGFVGLAQYLPLISLMLVVGVIIDRNDRRRIVALAQALGAAALALFVLATLAGRSSVVDIFILVVAIGVVRAFEHPANASLLPAVVGEAALPRAVAMSTSAIQTASIVGPALGGFLYAVHPLAPFGFAFACYAAGSLLVVGLKTRTHALSREPVTLTLVFSGFRFIFSRPVILGATTLDMVGVLLGGAVALLPIYAKDILMTGPWGLGLLRAAPAVGALAMSLVLTRFPIHRGVGLKMFAAVVAFGLGTVAFALSRDVVLSFAALAFTGAADVVGVVIRSSLVQLNTPDAMRGRVAAVNALFIGTSNQIGEFESGITAGLFGPVAAAVIGGVGCVVTALVWMRLFPALRHAETFQVNTAAAPAQPAGAR
jgi:MFS family permease